jgi:DNA-binding transcriptional LysR family regulator
MNLTQLQSLIAVAEAGSFTAAADKLGVTQSGMSQALAARQESLGVKLLIRQPRGDALTAFGERALDHGRTALSHLEAIEREAMALIGEETGRADKLQSHDAPSTSRLRPKVKKLSAASTQTPMAP